MNDFMDKIEEPSSLPILSVDRESFREMLDWRFTYAPSCIQHSSTTAHCCNDGDITKFVSDHQRVAIVATRDENADLHRKEVLLVQAEPERGTVSAEESIDKIVEQVINNLHNQEMELEKIYRKERRRVRRWSSGNAEYFFKKDRVIEVELYRNDPFFNAIDENSPVEDIIKKIERDDARQRLGIE